MEIFRGACDDCSMRAGEKQYRQRESEIQSFFDYLGIGSFPVRVSAGSPAERQEVSRQYEAFKDHVEETKTLSRRDFFKHLHDRALPKRQASARADAIAREVESGHRGPTLATRLLIEILKKYAGDTSREDRMVPGFTEIRADVNCTGCGACANLCSTGALAIDEDPTIVRLLWKPSHCSRCNLCFDVCSRKALHVAPCLDAGRIVGETASVVKEFQRHVCPECGNRFLSSGAVACCGDCLKAGNLMEALSTMIYGEERRILQ